MISIIITIAIIMREITIVRAIITRVVIIIIIIEVTLILSFAAFVYSMPEIFTN